MRNTEESNRRCPWIRGLQTEPQPEVYGFLQWKGTNACIDIHCSCGHSFHHDADFLYAVMCPACGRPWELDSTIRLIPMTEPCDWHEPTRIPDNGQDAQEMREDGIEPKTEPRYDLQAEEATELESLV